MPLWGRTYLQKTYFALICERHVTPRIITALKYASVIEANLPKLMGSGKIYWPHTGDERYCFVYENILGKPLLDVGERYPALHWNP